MKVQAPKELTLSVLWVDTLSVLVFLLWKWNSGGVCLRAGTRNLARCWK